MFRCGERVTSDPEEPFGTYCVWERGHLSKSHMDDSGLVARHNAPLEKMMTISVKMTYRQAYKVIEALRLNDIEEDNALADRMDSALDHYEEERDK